MTILWANFDLVLLVIAVLFFIGLKVYQLAKTPSESRQELIKTWLVEAVLVAEQKYGGKTGELKLSYVYRMFVNRFGWFGSLISEEVFNRLVDEALEIIEKTLQK
ncbi:hypothetical protein ACIQ1D_19275 [Lysinibacillus xylanilyticus]|uniref:hypothetical protein n=1 Tax=Lysinibacillus xylanilyticus TaxID=582475 RepID=UPI00382691E2